MHFEWMYSSDLYLAAMGIGVVPDNDKKIVSPEPIAKYTAEGGRIVRTEPYPGAAGLKAILLAIGMELSSG